MTSSQLETLLVERHWLIGLSRHLVAGIDEPEDVVQETYLRALRREDGLPTERPRGWLAKTARHVSQESKRGAVHRVAREREVATRESNAAAAPDEILAHAEFRSRVAVAVMALEESQRLCLVMRYYEGLTTAEIAKRMEVDPATVRQRISRGLARLRTMLDAESEERSWVLPALALAARSGLAGKGSNALSAAVLVPLLVAAVAAIGYLTLGPGEAATASAPAGPELAAVAPAREPGWPDALTMPENSVTEGRRVASLVSPPAVAHEIQVRLVSGEEREPVPGVRWLVIRTGASDRGRLEGLGPEEPNPKPIAEGVTAEDGVASFAIPEDPLVHFVTLGTESHARGSLPLLVEEAIDAPVEFLLPEGQTAVGRVMDENGRPVTDCVIIGRNFYDEYEILARPETSGIFEVAHQASFPRGFVLDKDGRPMAGRSDAVLIWAVPSELWTKTLRNPWAGQYGGIGFPGVDAEPVIKDIVLGSPIHVAGRVVDQLGEPIEGALVSTAFDRVAQAKGRRAQGKPRPLPWSPGGALAHEEALTEADGSFELLLRGTDYDLAAVAPSGGSASMRLDYLKPGATHTPVEFAIREEEAVELMLVDPARPGGELWRSGDGELAVVILPDIPAGQRVASPDHVQPKVRESGLVRVNAQMFGGSLVPGVVLVPGYAPARVDFGSGERSRKVELVRLPVAHATFLADGEEFAGTAHVAVSSTEPSRDWKGEYSMTVFFGSPFDHHSQVALGLPLNEPVEFSWGRTERVWIQVKPQASQAETGLPLLVFGPFTDPALPLTLDLTSALAEERTRSPAAPVGALLDTRAATVDLRVVAAEDGSPIQDAVLRARDEDVVQGGAASVHGKSREDGQLHAIASAGVGNWKLTAEGRRAVELDPLVIGPADQIDLGEIALERLDSLEGQLVQGTGEPLAERRWIHYEDPELGTLSARSQEDGTFVLFHSGVPPTRIHVQGPDGAHHASIEVPVEPASETSVTPGSVRCTVPPWKRVEVAVTGLNEVWGTMNTTLLAERADGAKVPLTRAGRVGDRTIFSALLPAGEWSLIKGPLIQVPTQRFELTTTPSKDPIHLETKATPVP
ncbi:RNA polymerase sigma factor SigX [Planctomycetes bacterium Poly30]|uniref:RNA polymerase sigma factor SigX n=1 Tax=Saltatorellus ferox TaxID=2528018 RepID=A0A518EX49_9BACT|nr:RNA polymerase sigma factor SigX [Planctomycetes bacterium Poly30]